MIWPELFLCNAWDYLVRDLAVSFTLTWRKCGIKARKPSSPESGGDSPTVKIGCSGISTGARPLELSQPQLPAGLVPSPDEQLLGLSAVRLVMNQAEVMRLSGNPRGALPHLVSRQQYHVPGWSARRLLNPVVVVAVWDFYEIGALSNNCCPLLLLGSVLIISLSAQVVCKIQLSFLCLNHAFYTKIEYPVYL